MRGEFDIEDMKYYMNLSAKQKLEYLERMLKFIKKITPPEAKELDSKLKEQGF